ncbi:MAG: hypothetical protein JSV60_07325, partial [Desulfobacterales bacterium]
AKHCRQAEHSLSRFIGTAGSFNTPTSTGNIEATMCGHIRERDTGMSDPAFLWKIEKKWGVSAPIFLFRLSS